MSTMTATTIADTTARIVATSCTLMIILTPDARLSLDSLLGQHHQRELQRRAQVILLRADGHT